MAGGAFGVSISGAGPTIFAICPDIGLAEQVADAMARALDAIGLSYRLRLAAAVSQSGARRVG